MDHQVLASNNQPCITDSDYKKNGNMPYIGTVSAALFYQPTMSAQPTAIWHQTPVLTSGIIPLSSLKSSTLATNGNAPVPIINGKSAKYPFQYMQRVLLPSSTTITLETKNVKSADENNALNQKKSNDFIVRTAMAAPSPIDSIASSSSSQTQNNHQADSLCISTVTTTVGQKPFNDNNNSNSSSANTITQSSIPIIDLTDITEDPSELNRFSANNCSVVVQQKDIQKKRVSFDSLRQVNNSDVTTTTGTVTNSSVSKPIQHRQNNTSNLKQNNMSTALMKFNEWKANNDPEGKLPQQELDSKLKEIFREFSTQFTMTQKSQKRQRSESCFGTNAGAPKKPSITKSSDDDSSNASRNSYSSNMETYDIINLDDMPSDAATVHRRHRTSEHNVLYNLLHKDATKRLQQQGVLKSVQQSSSSSSSVAKPSSQPVSVSSGNTNFQILNGQLSDATAPIRLLNKPIVPRVLKAEQPATKSIGMAEQLRRQIEENERKLYEQENNSTVKRADNSIKLVRSSGGQSAKRTMSGRSKSFSASNSSNMKFRFKIGTTHNVKRLTNNKVKRMRRNYDEDWKTLTDVLSTNAQSGPISAENVIKTEKLSEGSESDSRKSNGDASSQSSLPKRDRPESEALLTWNEARTSARLPKTSVFFERNEFDTIEINALGMSKCKAYYRIRKSQHEYSNFPNLQPSMPCGHCDVATCYNSVITRLFGHGPIAHKKPYQFSSNEFKEIIGSLVQNKGNNCRAINLQELHQAIAETKKCELIKASSEFHWQRFVKYYNEIREDKIFLAPANLFANSIPTTQNTFEINQKLEAVDPQNSDLFCVCTIAEKCGFRLKLHFDCYSSLYDFWVDADSANIFPAGWCFKTGREIEWPHRKYCANRSGLFDWSEYLTKTKSQAAHPACFNGKHINTAITNKNPFKIGMKLEADDRRNTRKICVATVGDVIDTRILVKFDGFEESANYWTEITSPYIHPANWHYENGFSITTPPNYKGDFQWDAYLRANRADAVPRSAFHTRKPREFAVGMALEVVDKKNPSLIRPAVVTMIDEFEIRILFIGWNEKYAYWIEDDSTDLHPAGYAQKTGHPIECPLTSDDMYKPPINDCGIRGCRGIGNAQYPERRSHKTLEECPYDLVNWQSDDRKNRVNRIDRKTKIVNSSFNVGAGPCRTRVTTNPALEKPSVSLEPLLNPTELATLSAKDIEMVRRLQVSMNFLLQNRRSLEKLHEEWSERMPMRIVQISAAEKNPLNWSIDEVTSFVSQLPNCSLLAPAFVEHEIDGLAFLALRQNDMVDRMGLSEGAAIKIFNRILALREECNVHYIKYT